MLQMLPLPLLKPMSQPLPPLELLLLLS